MVSVEISICTGTGLTGTGPGPGLTGTGPGVACSTKIPDAWISRQYRVVVWCLFKR